MTILSRHIFREFVTLVAGVLAGIIIVYLCVEFLQKADRLIKHHASVSQVIRYFLYSVPRMITMSLPMATLIAALLALGNLSRHNEIIAMRAGGVSILRIVSPLVTGGLLISVLGFINNEFIMPVYSSRANFIRNVEIEKKTRSVMYREHKLWLRGPENSIVNVNLIAPNRREMLGITVYKLNPDHTVREWIRAERLAWEENAWRLKQSTTYLHAEGSVVSRSSDDTAFNIVESPDDLGMIAKDPDEMNFVEMWDYVRKLKSSGYKTLEYEVNLHRKIAYPLASLLMVMIAIPFSIQKVRSGETSKGIALAVAIAFVYWTLASIGSSLGNTGVIPPELSAWLANIVFVVTASFVLVRLQQTL